jgi:type VII secretion protein EccE
MTAAPAAPQQESMRPMCARLRDPGAHLGPLPISNLVILEIGLALALALLAVDAALWGPALLVALIAVPLAFGRWHGRWLVRWIQLTSRYLARSPSSSLPHPDAPAAGDPRPALLSLLIPDLIVVHGTDQQREQVGFAWHQGTWTAVLEVEATPSMIAPVGAAAGLPLGALASCLEDRGVVLDAIQVIWHCYPGNAALPSSSPALRAYLEVLGPLSAAARRTT